MKEKKNFDIDEFYSKAWSKQNSLEIKRYISYAIKEINSRVVDDAVSETFLNKIGTEITGFTKKGKLSARVVGKTKEELLYEARTLHDYLDWDLTSDIAEKELLNKYKQAYDKYLEDPKHKYISQEAYERYVELVFAFKDLAKAYDSEQLRLLFDKIEDDRNPLDIKDLQRALIEASEENMPGLERTPRINEVKRILNEIILEKSYG